MNKSALSFNLVITKLFGANQISLLVSRESELLVKINAIGGLCQVVEKIPAVWKVKEFRIH